MQILMFAGPNGSGKSSIIKEFSQSENFPQKYICPDSYVNNYAYIEDEKKRYIKAMELCKKLRIEAVQNNESFAIETVFSTKEKLEFLEYAKSNNYSIETVYITTKNPYINVNRVIHRYRTGGHAVPIDKIISRYYKSMSNLHYIIEISDMIEVFDNSDKIPFAAFLKYNNKAYLLNKEKRNSWVEKYIIEPLSNNSFKIAADLNCDETKKILKTL